MNLWMYTGELFIRQATSRKLAEEGFGVDISLLKEEWMEKVKEVFEEATLTSPKRKV